MTDPPSADPASRDAPDRLGEAIRAAATAPGVSLAQQRAQVEAGLLGIAALPPSLDRYTLQRRIGSGAQGTVWRAYDPALRRDVAIKLLHASARGEQNERLMREARALAMVSHPNVVRVLDVGASDVGVFVVLEWLEGSDLSRWLRERPRGLAERWRSVVEVAHGLAAVHRHGLLHRDVKPANVLVGVDGRARLADFGLVRGGAEAQPVEPSGPTTTDRGGRSFAGDGVSLTEPGMVVGTPAYMAPECHRGEPASVASDVYSWCVLAIEVLWGARPFSGQNIDELVAQKQRGPGVLPAIAGVSASTRAALLRGLAPDPALRFASMDALLGAAASSRSGRRWAAVGAVAAVGALLVWGGGRTPLVTAPVECADVVARWSGIAAIADGLVRQVDTTPDVDANLGPRIRRHVDRWGASWRALACPRDDIDLELAAARQPCLDELGVQMLATLTSLRDAGAPATREIAALLIEVPEPATCRSPVVGASNTVVSSEADLLRRLTDVKVALRLGEMAAAIEAANAAVVLAKQSGSPRSSARAQASLARVQLARGDAVAAHDAWVHAHQLAVEGNDDIAATEAAIALVALELNENVDDDQAEHWSREAEARLVRLDGTFWYDILRARLDAENSGLHIARAEFDRAVTAAERGFDRLASVLQASDPRLAEAAASRGNAYAQAGRFPEAFAWYVDALATDLLVLGPRHPQIATRYQQLAVALSRAAQYPAAIPLLEHAAEILEGAGIGGADAGRVASSLSNVQRHAGRLPEAVTSMERAIASYRQAYPPTHARIGMCLRGLGAIYLETGDWQRAREVLQSSVDLLSIALGPEDERMSLVMHDLARAKIQLGDVEAGIALHVQALRLRERAFADTPNVALADSYVAVAQALDKAGRPAEATGYIDRAVALCDRIGDQNVIVSALTLRAAVRSEQGDHAAAQTDLRRATLVLERRGLGDSRRAMLVQLTLGRVARAGGDPAAAVVAFGRALELGTLTHAAEPLLNDVRDEIAATMLLMPRRRRPRAAG